MKRLVVPLAAVALVLSLARCGGDDDKKGDAGTAGLDASGHTVVGPDASAPLSGPDASTALPGPDASTAQPGPDASVPTTCDPFAQTGCTSPQKCTIDTNANYVCGAAGGSGDQASCTLDSDCAAGLTCVGVTGETGSRCRAFCSTTKACPTGQACVIAASATATAAILCMDVADCDPWTQTGCSNGQKCTLADLIGPAFTCGAAGSKTSQATCTADSECAAGLVCVNFGEGNKCYDLCKAGSRECPANSKCLGSAAEGQDAFICLPSTSCNPLTQDCTGSQGCYPVSASEWSCAASAGKTAGQACSYANDCVKGYICATTSSGNVCTQICNFAGGTPTCTTGTCQSKGTFGLCG